jgi:hypothetical protein
MIVCSTPAAAGEASVSYAWQCAAGLVTHFAMTPICGGMPPVIGAHKLDSGCCAAAYACTALGTLQQTVWTEHTQIPRFCRKAITSRVTRTCMPPWRRKLTWSPTCATQNNNDRQRTPLHKPFRRGHCVRHPQLKACKREGCSRSAQRCQSFPRYSRMHTQISRLKGTPFLPGDACIVSCTWLHSERSLQPPQIC